MSEGLKRIEEGFNTVTHAIGAGLSIAALSILVVYAALQGDPWRIVSFSIYGASLVILYLASTFYHVFHGHRLRAALRLVDHSAVYILIAGTYTPFTLVTIRGGWGWSIFGVIWGLAIAGIIFKTLLLGKYEVLSTILYVLMGWVIVIAIKPIANSLSWGGLMWLFLGGIIYTGGVVFYVWDKLPFNHAIWHLFVLGGSVCHFFAILFHVLPQ